MLRLQAAEKTLRKAWPQIRLIANAHGDKIYIMRKRHGMPPQEIGLIAHSGVITAPAEHIVKWALQILDPESCLANQVSQPVVNMTTESGLPK